MYDSVHSTSSFPTHFSLKTGVFPGNYVQHIKQEEEEKRRRRKEESDKTIDEIIDLDNAFTGGGGGGGGGGTKKGIVAPPPNVDLARQQASRENQAYSLKSVIDASFQALGHEWPCGQRAIAATEHKQEKLCKQSCFQAEGFMKGNF